MSRTIKNVNKDDISIEVIRYFVNNDIEYLIYSLNETDSSGYTKLYASKIIGNKACIITDEEEWNIIKKIIKEIIKNNRDGESLSVIDLNESNLDDIYLQDTRVFKLQGNLVNLLSDNKKIEQKNNDLDEIEEIDLNYEELFKNEQEKNKKLELELESLKEELNKYKEIFDKIKEIVE
ncbi:MAG TPA: hypothetical protein IAC20_05870 [Candidatus Faecisoma merdavium]|nr:hypothetical protein [Candidatus Faecisoma merdavium]